MDNYEEGRSVDHDSEVAERERDDEREANYQD